MKIQSSYIFLRKNESELKKDAAGNYVVQLGSSILDRLHESIPDLTRLVENPFSFRKQYIGTLNVFGFHSEVNIVILQVPKTTFVDLSVTATTSVRAVKTLEYIQNQLLDHRLDQEYISIISYDAISEYFCNKTFPKLNALERNLRKLLFNTYVAEFGQDYYRMTISEEIQKKAKGRVRSNGGKRAVEIKRIQEFFYSLEYGEIQVMLFTPQWTKVEEADKNMLLKKIEDFTKLTDGELRKAISQIGPKSDWERFFSRKINIDDVETSIDQLRVFRNSVAHMKFFSREDYSTCNKLIRSLNSAILNAIHITEEEDFVEKNTEALRASFARVLEKTQAFTQWMGERVVKTINTLTPYFEKLRKVVEQIEREDWIHNQLQMGIESETESEEIGNDSSCDEKID